MPINYHNAFKKSIFYLTIRKSAKSGLRMSSKVDLLKPPEQVRGMTRLDKSMFNTTLAVPTIDIKNSDISKVMPLLKKYVLKMPKIKYVRPSKDDSSKMCVLLNPNIVTMWTDIPNVDRTVLESFVTDIDLSTTDFLITYENYNAKDIFRAVLSDGHSFSSFSQIAHVIHINLKQHLVPYKSIIVDVLLDKITNARTVVNKIDIINNTYRNFEMEIFGDNDTAVSVKENGCEFVFEFADVYWNPRLGTEHERIVKMLNPNDVLFDVFAGVGPFAIPAAKKKCIVFANDLNPKSYEWLNYNAKINKIKLQHFKAYNKDGRDFIKTDVKENLIKYINNRNIHIIMNLPALAVEFLDVFCNLYRTNEIPEIINPPILHVYCFAKGEKFVDIAKNLVFKNIGFNIENKIINIFRVRTVSSFKEMMRISIILDKDILISTDVINKKSDCCDVNIEVPTKKCRYGEEQKQTNEECIQSRGCEEHINEV